MRRTIGSRQIQTRRHDQRHHCPDCKELAALNAAVTERNIIIGECYQVLQALGIKEASTHLPDAIKAALEEAVKVEIDKREKAWTEVHELEFKLGQAREQIAALTAERDGFRNGQAQIQAIADGLMDTIEKYAGERKELFAKLKSINSTDKVAPKGTPCQCGAYKADGRGGIQEGEKEAE